MDQVYQDDWASKLGGALGDLENHSTEADFAEWLADWLLDHPDGKYRNNEIPHHRFEGPWLLGYILSATLGSERTYRNFFDFTVPPPRWSVLPPLSVANVIAVVKANPEAVLHTQVLFSACFPCAYSEDGQDSIDPDDPWSALTRFPDDCETMPWACGHIYGHDLVLPVLDAMLVASPDRTGSVLADYLFGMAWGPAYMDEDYDLQRCLPGGLQSVPEEGNVARCQQQMMNVVTTAFQLEDARIQKIAQTSAPPNADERATFTTKLLSQTRLAQQLSGDAHTCTAGQYMLHVIAESVCAWAWELAIGPVAKASGEAARSKDGNGNLPIHLAAQNGRMVGPVMAAIIAANPAGAKEKDSNGNLPIHMAIKNKRFDCVRALFEAHPEGAQEADPAGIVTCNLEVAIKAQLPIVEIERLLKAGPAAANCLHMVMEYVKSAGLAAAMVAAFVAANTDASQELNTDGHLPVTVGLLHDAPTAAVAALLAAAPGGALDDDQGRAALEGRSAEFKRGLYSTRTSCAQSQAVDNMVLILKKCPSVLLQHSFLNRASNASEYDPSWLLCVQKIIDSYPEAAKIKDGDGALLLHHALRLEHITLFQAQSGHLVISSLLKAWPAATKEKDSNGNLPIHLAVQNEMMGGPVMAAIIAANPGGAKEKDSNGNLPIHLAVQNKMMVGPVMAAIIAANPEGAKEKDSNGNLPIHLAVQNEMMVGPVMAAIIAANPAGAKEKDSNGNLPIHMAIKNKRFDCVRALFEAHPESAQEADPAGTVTCNLEVAIKAQLPIVEIERLLKADPAAAKGHRAPNCLHMVMEYVKSAGLATAMVAAFVAANTDASQELDEDGHLPVTVGLLHDAPTAAVAALLAAAPESVSAKRDKGRTVLHDAIAALLDSNQQYRSNPISSKFESVFVDNLAQVLEINPAASAEKDTRGSTPLHLLVQGCAKSMSQTTQRALQMVIEAHPAAAKTEDADGMLPLCLAIHTFSGSHLQATSGFMITALLKGCPDATKMASSLDGRLPLHVLASTPAVSNAITHAVIEAFPEAANVKDVNGMLPFHLAIQIRPYPKVIVAIIDAFPDVAKQAIETSKLPWLLPAMLDAGVERPLPALGLGTDVVLTGLQKSKTLNGKTGVIRSRATNENGRWEVEVLSTDDQQNIVTNIKPENLVSLPLPWDPAAVILPLHAELLRGRQCSTVVIEALLRVHPHAATITVGGTKSVLQVAIEQQAPPSAIAALLSVSPDHAKAKMYVVEGENGVFHSQNGVCHSQEQDCVRHGPGGSVELVRGVSRGGYYHGGHFVYKESSLPTLCEVDGEHRGVGYIENHSALLLAIKMHPLPTVIEKLLQLNPGAATEQSRTVRVSKIEHHEPDIGGGACNFTTDKYSLVEPHYPLDFAISNRECPPETMQQLLDASTSTTGKSKFLHDALITFATLDAKQGSTQAGKIIAMLAKWHPAAAEKLIDGQDGAIPLHTAIMLHADAKIDFNGANEVYSAFPEAVFAKNDAGVTPLHPYASTASHTKVLIALFTSAAITTGDGAGTTTTGRDINDPIAELNNKSLLALVVELGFDECAVRLIKEYGASSQDAAQLAELSHNAELRQWGLDFGRLLSLYRLAPGKPKHVSPTCVVIFATRAGSDADKSETPVALKLMADKEAFMREIAQREQLQLGGSSRSRDSDGRGHRTFCISIIEQYADTKPGTFDQFPVLRLSSESAKEPTKLRHVLVMERGINDLTDIISHSDIAGVSVLKVTDTLRSVAESLQELNDNQKVMHGDIKGRNFVLMADSELAAIDLDAAAGIDGAQLAGQKPTSSGFLPPEQAAVVLWNRQNSGDSPTPALSSPAPPPVAASAQYDMWAFGVMAYQLVTGHQLFNYSVTEEVDDEDLQTIVEWSDRTKKKKLNKVTRQWPNYKELLGQLLSKDPDDRPGSWSDVLDQLPTLLASSMPVDVGQMMAKIDSVRATVEAESARVQMHVSTEAEQTRAAVAALNSTVMDECAATRKLVLDINNVPAPYLYEIVQVPKEGLVASLKESAKSGGFGKRLDDACSLLGRMNSASTLLGAFNSSKGAFEGKYELRLLCGVTLEPVVVYELSETHPTLVKCASAGAKVAKIGLKVATFWNAGAGVAHLFGVPVPKIPKDHVKKCEAYLNDLKGGNEQMDTLKEQQVEGMDFEQLDEFASYLQGLDEQGKAQDADGEPVESWKSKLKITEDPSNKGQVTFACASALRTFGGGDTAKGAAKQSDSAGKKQPLRASPKEEKRLQQQQQSTPLPPPTAMVVNPAFEMAPGAAEDSGSDAYLEVGAGDGDSSGALLEQMGLLLSKMEAMQECQETMGGKMEGMEEKVDNIDGKGCCVVM